MTLPENISLESMVKNPEYSLEIFNIEGEDTKVDRSRYLPIPKKAIAQHRSQSTFTKIAEIDIQCEYVFLYNESITEGILMPTNNYNNILEISQQAVNNEQAKNFLEYFKKKTPITLKLISGKHVMEGIPLEFRPIGQWQNFTAENEPYMHMNPVITNTI
jgi:hypothetical protein